MIIGGVIFGVFAALTYWWPKFTGFMLNEKIGTYAFWCWLIGFLLAFVPLYILGMMGATRRLDHYDASLGWQWLFIVAAVGVVVIGAGIALQLWQIVYSIYKRNENRVDGDPWGGRTLEWATTSPPQHYNFPITPHVSTRDAWWAQKHSKAKPHATSEDILMPKNTGAGVIIAGFSLLIGFALIWHIWWLAALSLVGGLAVIIVRLSNDDTEYVITAKEVAKHEAAISGAEA